MHRFVITEIVKASHSFCHNFCDTSLRDTAEVSVFL